jgi:hypothetical protein
MDKILTAHPLYMLFVTWHLGTRTSLPSSFLNFMYFCMDNVIKRRENLKVTEV